MNAIDDYINQLPDSQVVQLNRIRNLVKRHVPESTETISYGMPTFKYNGKVLFHCGAFKDHMSLFPTGDHKITELSSELEKFRTSKGTYQFTDTNPIPDYLIEKIITARMQSIGSK